MSLTDRPRRLRSNPLIRDLVAEHIPRLSQLIQPYFILPRPSGTEPIDGFTNIFRHGWQSLATQVEKDVKNGVRSFLLFGASEKKDAAGSEAWSETNAIGRALVELRRKFGNDIVLLTDVCLCPYTDHGHCGVMSGDVIQNDESVKSIARIALAHAKMGANFVSPSDMMDGRVGAIRQLLDKEGYSDTGILSYAVKFASSYYGPFREALKSQPKGDRSTYQMDYRNSTESLREVHLDEREGADILMVKPALAYLDIIHRVRQSTQLPVAAYSVSGEYEMVKRMAAAKLADERSLVLENLTAITRAGAGLIVSYYASEAAEKGWLKS